MRDNMDQTTKLDEDKMVSTTWKATRTPVTVLTSEQDVWLCVKRAVEEGYESGVIEILVAGICTIDCV